MVRFLRSEPEPQSMYFKISAFVSTFLFVAAAVFAQTPSVDAPVGGLFLIGPGDEITVKVLGEPQFDFVTSVDNAGNLEVPFFTTPVAAGCKSERDLSGEVAKLLTKYLRDPQVNLRVTKRNSRPPVSIYGEVRQQQQVDLTRRAHLMELISFAGGVTDKSGGTIQVFRSRPPMCSKPGGPNDWSSSASASDGISVPSRVFDISDLQLGREGSNPEILPGDIIVVQKADPVYVTGEVMKPGELSMPEGGLPLTQAIAMASGITREAKTKNIKIYRRKSGGQPEVIAANFEQIKKGLQPDVQLQAFDIVEVDKAKKSIGQILLDALTGIPGRLPIPIRPF